jgi:hypothetical protein
MLVSTSMAREPQTGRGKRVVFDQETWRALDLLTHEQMKSSDEISAEAFRDLLWKYGQPESLKQHSSKACGERATLRRERQSSNPKLLRVDEKPCQRPRQRFSGEPQGVCCIYRAAPVFCAPPCPVELGADCVVLDPDAVGDVWVP